MGRRKGSKNLNGEEPWKKYGLTRDAYYSRLTKGIPLEQPPRKGRRKNKENIEGGRVKRCKYCGDIFQYKSNLAQMCPDCKKEYHRGYVHVINNFDKRFSGLSYENSEERLNEIRGKYKDGVTDEIIGDFVDKFFSEEY